MSRAAATEKFREEAERMLRLVEGLDPVFAAKPILIERIRGIEDSSRNWSALMTLDHLVIVDRGIAATISHLVEGKPITGRASTAAVKPKPEQTPETIGVFRKVTGQYLDRVGALPDLNSRLRYEHPWFGPLNAHGWHVLAAVHHGIHRRQIERIIATAAP